MLAPAPCSQSKEAVIYRRRRPEHTVLYQTVQAHLETWLAQKWEDEDGDALCFHEATALAEAEVVAVEGLVRTRVLALFEQRGLLSTEAVADMRQWEHGGGPSSGSGHGSLSRSSRVAPKGRIEGAGLERLLRHCARPAVPTDGSVERAFAAAKLAGEYKGLRGPDFHAAIPPQLAAVLQETRDY
jgi:hypothetical protein